MVFFSFSPPPPPPPPCIQEMTDCFSSTCLCFLVYVHAVTDEELMQRAGLRPPQEVSGISGAIVVDNIPKVEKDRVAKLKVVIMKVMSRFGTIVGDPFFPTDEKGTTKG